MCDFSVVADFAAIIREKKSIDQGFLPLRGALSSLNRLLSSCPFLLRCLFRRFVLKQENKLVGSPRCHTVSETLPLSWSLDQHQR